MIGGELRQIPECVIHHDARLTVVDAVGQAAFGDAIGTEVTQMRRQRQIGELPLPVYVLAGPVFAQNDAVLAFRQI